MESARVVLIGMMGAGKSTIGLALSHATGWPYVDNDEVVAHISGMPTRDLLLTKGEPALRVAESAAVDRVLATDPPVVAGAAAGIVGDQAVCDRLHAGAFVVYLRARIETLEQRVKGTYRPWLGADPGEALRKLATGREPLYEKLAHLIVEVDDETPESVAARILAALGKTAAQ